MTELLVTTGAELTVMSVLVRVLWIRVDRIDRKLNNGISERLARLEGHIETLENK